MWVIFVKIIVHSYFTLILIQCIYILNMRSVHCWDVVLYTQQTYPMISTPTLLHKQAFSLKIAHISTHINITIVCNEIFSNKWHHQFLSWKHPKNWTHRKLFRYDWSKTTKFFSSLCVILQIFYICPKLRGSCISFPFIEFANATRNIEFNICIMRLCVL